ncbi:unnamed protein product [Rhizoctonia solani]|uniref:O-methylsterigmatocystin oxidoreductase n=1 Tax=Rhizoctonia solani TaxID=456999 RepID=A0A8H2WAR6_9AGAM|nr:unnamed protein product [Rhizoctonia solani]
MAHLYAYGTILSLSTLLLWIRSRRNRRYDSLPPSPKADPLIGNLRTLMKVVDEPRTYRDWGMGLGSDIISITLPGKVIIVLNSQEAVEEIFARRALIYSDRPFVPMISNENLMGWGNLTRMLRYGERWRFQRKLTDEALHKNASKAMWPLVERQTHLILHRLLANPGQFSEEIKRVSGATVLMSVYGYDAASVDDNLFNIVETAVRSVSEALVVQNFLVNTFPWLEYVPEWFPGAMWKAKANEWRRQRDLMLHIPFEWTKSKMSTVTATTSMLSSWLTKYTYMHPADSDLSIAELEDRIRWASSTIFFAATDTTVSSIRTFIMAMAMHLDIQTKAQAEIDSVIGTRLPELADQGSLKYVQCIVKEVLRWRLIKPLAAPHACIQDDTYKGYHIPKGALVVGNTWAISNNPDVYPDPDCFKPDRFLDSSVPEAPAFGFGRRICPGAHHAKSVLFIIAASILSMFEIRPEADENGKPIPLSAEQKMNGAVWELLPFKCKITPRSEAHERIIKESVSI